MVSVQTFSEVGGHAVNEDAFVAQPHPLDPDLWLCFLADGQGGRAGGAQAAQLACRAALAAAGDSPPKKLVKGLVWLEILRFADEQVRKNPAAGFTTLVGFCIARDRVLGASNGDSAALLLNGDSAFELTAAQPKNPPIGSGAAGAATFSAALGECWQVLVMSDGVWKYVDWNTIIALARRERGTALITQLQQSARLPQSGEFQDDFTVVVLAR